MFTPSSTQHPYMSAQIILRNVNHPIKIAILEISTRACKLLIADIRELQQGFTWDGFRSEGNLTNLGLQMDDNGAIPWESFATAVLPHLQRHLARLRNHNIDHVYTIATAALRQAENSDALLERLHTELGIQVQVLTQEEEGKAAAAAYQWHAPTTTENNLLLIDQGGGSTEILAFDKDLSPITFEQTPSLQMGTSSAIQWIQNTASQLPISEALATFQTHFQRVLDAHLTSLKDSGPFSLVGMGSGLTQATHKRGNQHQHGIVLSQEQLQQEISSAIKQLSHGFIDFTAIYDYAKTLDTDSTEHQRLFDLLAKLVGCTMVEQILATLDCPSVTVNGLGLRYGVCRQIIEHYYPDLIRGRHQLLLQQNSMSIDGIQEGAYTIGKVISIADFGAFVQLQHDHIGLLHKSEVSSARIRALRGRPIRVKVRNIFKDANGKQCFDLEL